MIAAGKTVLFENLKIGMKVEAAREGYDDVVVRGTIGEIIDPWVYSLEHTRGDGGRYAIGRKDETFTLTETWQPLPEVEGLAVASWAAKPNVGIARAGVNEVGYWRLGDDGWRFRPMKPSSIWSVSAPRITSLTLVDPVPLKAMELLAEAQHLAHDRHEDYVRVGVLDGFFRRVNEVT